MSKKSKILEQDNAYNITVTGRHIHVTDAMKDYAIEKVSKIERFSAHIIDVLVIMDIQKLDHTVSVILKVDHIKIKAQATTLDMYASIEKSIKKIQTQVRKYRDKIQDHQAKAVSVVDMNVNVLRRPHNEIEDINEDIEQVSREKMEEEYRPNEIVARETRPLKLLTQEEALMKMELSEDSFLIFRLEEDNKIKVIYRRDDGDFGVIETE